jgi:hypothetical protein
MTTFLVLERRYRLHWRLVEFLLFMMVIGPLIAPFFSRIPDPMYQAVAAFIFKIGDVICPQPGVAFQYGGMAFAVCYRCLAALVGLIISRWLHRPGGVLYNWSLKYQLAALAACILWLEIDVQAIAHGLWQVNILFMIAHGVPYGISVGAVCLAPLVALDKWLDRQILRRRQTAAKPDPRTAPALS